MLAASSAILGALLLVVATAGPASAQAAEADVFVARAILAYEGKRYEDALAALREALELVPGHVDALYYSGLVLTAMGRLDEAAAALEQARSRAPRDETILFQLGVAYLGLGKYEQAQPLLEQAFALNSKLDSAGFYVGFLRHRAGDYQGALRAFRNGVSSNPEIQQLTRFYTGLAFRALGLPERGAAEIEQALRLLPASPLTGPAERVREAFVTAREREQRFRAEIRLGGFYDDNVPVFPEPSPDPSIQDLQRRRRESFGELGSLRLDYSFLRAGSLDLSTSYSFFTTYNNDLPDFNLVSHVGGLAGLYRAPLDGRPVYLYLPYTYEFSTLGGDDFIQRHIVGPSAGFAANSFNLTTLQGRYQYKSFLDEGSLAREERRTGTNWMGGLTHLFRFARDRHLLKLGYQWDFDDTEGSNHAYFGHRILAGAQYTLPWRGIRLNYDFDVHLRDYRHLHTTLPPDAPNTKERSDTEYTHVVALTVPLPWNFSLVTQYQLTDARSNLDLFTFKRNVVFLFLIWTY